MENPVAALLLGLDLLPPHADGTCVGRRTVAEDVRMTPHELLVHVPGDALEVSSILLLEQEGEEEDLEEEVTELALQLGMVARNRSVRDLVGLLDRVRHDREGGLLPIPRAVSPEAARQFLEVEERLRERHRPRAYSVSASVSVFVSSGSSGGS